MNSSLQYRKIREFELCSKPFSKHLPSFSSSSGKMVTRQCNRKGMYPTRDALKSYEGSVFHLPGAGHREFHHFPRSYQVMSIERGAQYRPSTPYYRSNGYTRIFWYPSLSIISPFFIIFIFPPFFSTVSTLYMLNIMEVSVWMKPKYLLFFQIFISFSCI